MKLWLLTLVLFSSEASRGQSAVSTEKNLQTEGNISIQADKASANVIKKVDPIYPPLAKQIRLQGIVRLQIVVAKSGAVSSVAVLSGHPLLVQAAINAAKQWEYKPFLVDGQAVSIRTVIEVPFSLGISEADSRLEQQNNDNYFKAQGECRKLLREHKFSDANDVCISLPQLAEKLPPERKNERRLANEFAGSVVFNEEKFPEALQYYEREVSIAEESLKPYEAELGYAYHDVARGYHMTGDPAKAQHYYEKSEETLRQAREHIDGDFLKNEYRKAIQSVLRDYIVLLGQTGQDKLSMNAQERLKTVTTEVH